MPFATSNFLLLEVRPGSPSSDAVVTSDETTGAQGVLKLADFGLAREFVDGQSLEAEMGGWNLARKSWF